MISDRFTHLAHQSDAWWDNQSIDTTEQWAANLLRAEYRWVVRMVRAVSQQTIVQKYADDPKCRAYQMACHVILARLKKRKK